MSKEQAASPYPSSQQWTSPVSAKPYPPPPEQGGYPAHASYAQLQHPSSNDMVTLPPPQSHLQQEMYRPHNSYDMYQGPPPHQQQQPPPPPPPPHQQMPYPQQHPNNVGFNQPAPRQRTAIACRYCRRRKIRCHGFDSSPDGRCTNCLRFHQECIFTPVSSQAHAFVPAHTAYPHLRNTGRGQPPPPDGRGGGMYPPIYGAHGQPLPMSHQTGPHDQGYSPGGPPPPPPPPGYGAGPYPGLGYDDRSPLPPHAQDQQRLAPAGRRSSSGAFEYPDPTQMAPGGGPAPASYGAAPYPPPGPPQPYYPPQQPPPPGPSSARRTSPPSAGGYSYDAHARASVSPHGSTSSAGYPPFPGGLHPPQVLPPTFDAGRTPPPPQRDGASGGGGVGVNGSRPGMSVRDMLGPEGGPSRSSTDSDMLKALNRGGV